MASLSDLANRGVRLHKQLAMGVEASLPEGDGMPSASRTDKSPALSRSEGRAPDAKKSGMPKCDPESPPFWEGGHDSQPDSGKIKVAAHTRSKPGSY